MSMFKSCKKKADKRTTEFSEFIRNGSSREKKTGLYRCFKKSDGSAVAANAGSQVREVIKRKA